nr:MAG: RNA-dependent RNA polymerase [Riboviria sp.]
MEKLVVRNMPEHCVKIRRFSRFRGVPSSRYVNTHTPCSHNALRGIVERVFLRNGQRPLVTSRDEFQEALNGFHMRLRSELPRATPIPLADCPGLWLGRHRARYERAFKATASVGWSPRDARSDAFPKSEKTLFAAAKPDPAPRLINPRKPAYNLRLARYVKVQEKRVYEAINRAAFVGPALWKGKRCPVVLKCYNAIERAEILYSMCNSVDDWVAVGLDASRFDQHVSVAALLWEHSNYLHMYRGQPDALRELAALLKCQLFNKGRVKMFDGCVIDYAVEGCRMSGDMNTALGNCMIMSGLVSGLLEKLNIVGHYANDGDDCIVILPRAHLERFQASVDDHFKSAGFNVVVEAPVDVFEKIEFCQSHPVWNGEQYIMCRNWVKCINNDAAGFGKWNDPRQIPFQLAAVGQCGGHLCAGIPILQAFYSSMREQGHYRKVYHELAETGFGRMAIGLQRRIGMSVDAKVRDRAVTPRARFSFWLAYGVTPEQQRIMESVQFDFSHSTTEHIPTEQGPQGAVATPGRVLPSSHPILSLHDGLFGN